MTKQLFAIQDTYGKSKDDLEILMEAMIEDLIDFDLQEIENSFKIWRKKSEKIPTVAGILKIINTEKNKEINKKNHKTLSDFGGDFKKYKKYAIENGFWLKDN